MLKLLLIGILVAGIAPAQRGGGRGRGGSGGDGMGFPAARKNHLEQMTDALQLTKEQKRDVKALMDEAQKEAAPVREQMTRSRAQVAAAIASGKQDELDKAIKSHGDVEAQMAAVEMKAFAGVYKMLDAEQQTKSRAAFVMMPGIFGHKNWLEVE